MTNKKLQIAIVGAGMGGLAVAATLRQAGFDVQVYEQASRFGRIGAGIQMMPNSMKVLRRIGIEDRLRAVAFAPYSHLNRDGYTGEMTRELPMPESLYGAPYLCMHRAELHDRLRGGDEAVGDGDHFVAGPDAAGAQGQIERVGPRRHPDGVLDAAVGGELRLEGPDVGAEEELHPVERVEERDQDFALDGAVLGFEIDERDLHLLLLLRHAL